MSLQNSSYDWKYYTDSSDKASLSLNGNRSYWPRGKMLGGSSALNALLYVRGNQRDFDRYWQFAENSDWSWKSVLPFFEKLEKTHSSTVINGQLRVESFPSSTNDELFKIMLERLYDELNVGKLNNKNENVHIGFGRAKGNIYKGKRHSSAKAYLDSSVVGGRQNLHIIKHAHVLKLFTDNVSSQVNGVEFTRTIEGITMTVKSRKEIILSAGTVNTPQILMLSGIGPMEHIKAKNIPLVNDLIGVGANLQDHIIVPYVLSFRKLTPSQSSLRSLVERYLQFIFNNTGSFANLGSVDYMGFLNTKYDGPFPDIQILNFMLPKQSTDAVQILLRLFNYQRNVIDSIVAANYKSDTLLIFVALLNPKSHGKIELRTNNAFDSPIIEPNYLHNSEDVETLIRALKILKRLPSTKTFREHGGEEVRIKLDECNSFHYGTYRYLECYIRHLALTLYHPVGTCKMGLNVYDGSVVSETLEVYGIKGLRIADASMYVAYECI